jgi:hypothetical protein
MLPSHRRWVAPTLDLLSIVAFIVIGRDRHSVAWDLEWFVVVWWPLTLGWVVVALLTRLYTQPDRMWIRLAATIVGGVLLGGLLRIPTGRIAYSIFTVVALGTLTIFTFGWRLVAVGLARRRARTAPAG